MIPVLIQRILNGFKAILENSKQKMVIRKKEYKKYLVLLMLGIATQFIIFA